MHPTASTAAYRVVMEALTNAREHAHGATAVDVTLHRTGNDIGIRVTDDGRPDPGEPGPGEPGPGRPVPGRSGGFGLRGLRERVTAAGGTLSAGPAPHGGWVVEADLPVGAGEEA
ncbi:ATP-binding protein [Saccharothrix sp. MB29]|nr:ATP-binding protein [Saccharothrix sp. MB29]